MVSYNYSCIVVLHKKGGKLVLLLQPRPLSHDMSHDMVPPSCTGSTFSQELEMAIQHPAQLIYHSTKWALPKGYK